MSALHFLSVHSMRIFGSWSPPPVRSAVACHASGFVREQNQVPVLRISSEQILGNSTQVRLVFCDCPCLHAHVPQVEDVCPFSRD